MEPAEEAVDGRLGVSLRVAVTGHRWLDSSDPALVETVRDALVELQAACSSSATATTPVGLTVVSSLAEGADRIAVRASADLGARVEVVLPLPAEEYVRDFADDASRAEFRRMLDDADAVYTVPGRERPDAYLAAGEAAVQRCDVLLALWDGSPAQGTGGTAQVVDAAGAAGRPLAWVEVAGPDSTSRPRDRTFPVQIDLVSPEAFASLDRYNRQRVDIDPHTVPSGFPRSGEVSGFLLPYFQRADGLATRRQRTFRRTSVVLYVLSILAICSPALQLVYFEGEQALLTWVEVISLLAVIGLLVAGRRTLVLERWLAARFLAERIRSLAFLAELNDTEGVPTSALPSQSHAAPSDEWRDRVVQELAWAVPRPYDDPGMLRRAISARLVEEWVQPQISYHQATGRYVARRSRELRWVAVALFSLSVCAALAHAVGLHVTQHLDPVFIAIAAPTVAAAISGYAAQRDFPRLALTSQRMVQNLSDAVADIRKASTLDQLRSVAERVDVILQGESIDWYSTARLRAPEVP